MPRDRRRGSPFTVTGMSRTSTNQGGPMRTRMSWIRPRILATLLGVAMAVSGALAPAQTSTPAKPSPAAPAKPATAAPAKPSAGAAAKPAAATPVKVNPLREAYFGQTHSHTSWSVDAYLIGNHLTTPEDAYKFSMGLPIKHPAGFEVKLKGAPLDFHAVTDHSEYVGVIAIANDPTSDLSKSEVGKKLQAKNKDDFNRVFQWIAGSLAKHEPIKELLSPEIAGSVWKKNIGIADQYYKPGKFTTFAAYEWTSAPNSRNMHRNVIFKDTKHVPAL